MESIGLYFSKTQDDVSVCMDCYREHYRVIDVFYPKNERVKEMVGRVIRVIVEINSNDEELSNRLYETVYEAAGTVSTDMRKRVICEFDGVQKIITRRERWLKTQNNF